MHNSIPLSEGTYPGFALEDLEFEHGDLLMRSALAQVGDRNKSHRYEVHIARLLGSGCRSATLEWRRDRRNVSAELSGAIALGPLQGGLQRY